MTIKDFDRFQRLIEDQLLSHPIIVRNPYTEWFERGEADAEQLADLVLQFSVFSNHFIVLQAKRLIFASTEEGERCARNILVNECGVGLDRTTGSAEGRTFSSANAHINWLRELGAALGLPSSTLGRWDQASEATRRFLLGLDRTYGSPDPSTGAGASFAVENWAAFGIGRPELEGRNFWRQLIAGLEAQNRRRVQDGLRELPLRFFRYHFQLESGHSANVWAELRESFGARGFEAAAFLAAGRKALDSVWTFWEGLDQSRRRLDAAAADGINVAQWAV